MATLVQNKKAYFNYEILEKFEAGLELLGGEVKSLRAGQGSLDGAHVVVRGGEAYLVGATISLYQPGNVAPGKPSYDPDRPRRLLLGSKQLKELGGKGEQKGLTIVPISVYNKGRFLKLEIGLGRGKKKFDKRETIKKREVNRELRRTLKK